MKRPEWATHYFVNTGGLKVWFNPETGMAQGGWMDNPVTLSGVHYAFGICKPVNG